MNTNIKGDLEWTDENYTKKIKKKKNQTTTQTQMVFNGTILGMSVKLDIKLDPNKVQTIKQQLGLTRDNDKITVKLLKCEQTKFEDHDQSQEEEDSQEE
jgi:hypothetical protein